MKFCGRKKEKREHFILFYLFHHLDFYFHLNFLSFFCFFTRKSEKDGNSKGKKKDFFQLIFCQILFSQRSIVKILTVVYVVEKEEMAEETTESQTLNIFAPERIKEK